MMIAKRPLRVFLLVGLTASVAMLAIPTVRIDADAADVFISEYIEGSSNNKAIEIYNGTGTAVDLAADGYNVQTFFNGSVTAGLTVNLTGVVASGDVFVLAQNSANAAILAQADQTNGAGWFNGDDAIVLRKGTTIVDVIGQVGADPGTEWGTGLLSTADNTLRRQTGLCAGDSDGSNAFDPAAEWDGLANDAVDGLGTHTGCTNSDEDPPVSCSLPYTRIPSIQGSLGTAAITGPVDTAGVVVGDFELPAGSGIRGFYIQDPAGDGDATTSDGIFVFNGNNDSVAVGDLVRVSGTAGEFQEQTQISASSVITCGTGTVAPVDVTLPLNSADALEPFEGMLVRLPQTLAVTEHFQLGRFGEVVVSSGGRLSQPTQIASPGPDALAQQALNDLNRLIIDDGNNLQNVDPIVFARGGLPLSASNTLRGGDTVTGAVGVMTFTWAGNAASGNAFRVRPAGALNGTAAFQPANPRPAEAPERTGTLRVAGMNLLNFFNTFGGACTNGVGGAPTDCRGADNASEFDRQWPKTVAAIMGTEADVIGIIEIENDGYGPSSANAFLIDRLNAATAPGTYAFVDVDAAAGQVNALGTDAIKVGLIYKPSRVITVGQTAALNTVAFVNGGDSAPRTRPALAQAFEQIGTGARFVVSVNHFKSKGSECDTPDAGDGQGNCNAVRTNAATELATWLAGDPTGTGDPDVLIMGDLNAYAMEDPVSTLTSAGYTSLVSAFGGEGHSFAFDGQWGSLDHALASDSLAVQVTGAEEWLINADEPNVLDYNVNFKSAGQIISLYGPDAFRMADHNPVLVDLSLDVETDQSSGALGLGHLVLTNSSGLKAGDAGAKNSFALSGKFSRLLRRPIGLATVIVRRTETDGPHVYLVRTRLFASMLTDGASGKATLAAPARIVDITAPTAPILLDPQASVRLTLDDNGSPGAFADAIGITVWNRQGQLWFSSNWDGTTTIEQPIAAGSIRVR